MEVWLGGIYPPIPQSQWVGTECTYFFDGEFWHGGVSRFWVSVILFYLACVSREPMEGPNIKIMPPVPSHDVLPLSPPYN